MMVKKQGVDMTQGSPGKLILRFAVPMLLGNVVQQLYSAVDSAVVGVMWAKTPWRLWAPRSPS